MRFLLQIYHNYTDVAGSGDPAASSKGSGGSETKKTDPLSEQEILDAAVEAYLPGMIASQLMLNSTIFNFAKDAIDEAEGRGPRRSRIDRPSRADARGKGILLRIFEGIS